MPEIVSGAEYSTFINTFRCKPSGQDEVVRINVEIVDQVASTFAMSMRCGQGSPTRAR